MKKRCYILIVTLIMLLCGCSNDGDEKFNTENTKQTVSLQMGMIDSLNPLDAQKQSVRDAMYLCFEPLFEVQGDITVKGVLAESIKINDDCTTAIVKLKDSVLWHDGMMFTASDVIHTINAIKENPASPYSFCVKYIDEVSTIDALTLKIKLLRPYSQIAHSLYFPIIPAHISNYTDNMVGTGAYVFENYTKSSSLELKRNDSWHGGDVRVPHIKITIVRDADTAAAAFNTGVIDAITGDYFDLSNYVIKSNMRSVRYSSPKYEFLAFNHKSTLFDSSSMRSAVSLALDRKQIVEEAYGLNAVATNVPIHPNAESASLLTYSEYNLNSAVEMFYYEGYSIEKETNVMKNEKGEKLKFTILVNEENESRVKCAEIIKNQLLKAGIEVIVNAQPYEFYIDSIKNGNFEAYLGGVKSANIYDYEYLFSTEGEMNNYGYSSRYMELALAAISSSPDSATLENATENFDEVFTREQPVCGIAYLSDVLITSDSVKGKLLPQLNSPYANCKGWSK